jgi:DNA-binding IclR family transcriptional regulator
MANTKPEPVLVGGHDAEELKKIVQGLADAQRLRILAVLAGAPAEGMHIAEINDALGMAQSSISQQLKVLLKAGIVGHQKRVTHSYYWLRPEVISVVAEVLHGLAPGVKRRK